MNSHFLDNFIIGENFDTFSGCLEGSLSYEIHTPLLFDFYSLGNGGNVEIEVG